MILTFDTDAVRNLLETSRNSTSRQPNFEQVCDPQMWRDDLDVDRRKEALLELADKGYVSSITSDDVDPLKLPAGLLLVGDQGVYLMSNAPIEEVKAAGHKHVHYAREVNPETMPVDQWYDAKRASFGGDDGVEFLDAETLDRVLSQGAKTLEIDMTPDAMAILVPTETPEP